MSEKEKTIVELKKEDRDLLKSVIDHVSKMPSPSGDPSETDTEKGHESIEEIVACPDCYPKARDLVLPKVWEETKNLDHECTECGLGVKGEESAKEEWKCKECGSKTARSRD